MIMLTFFTVSIFSQDSYLVKGVTVSGTDFTSLPGVSVIVKNTLKGTDTDYDGKFSLNVKKGDILVFSYLGFKETEVLLDGSEVIEVYMDEDNDITDEIVLVGYGTAKKSQVTGSVAKIKNDNLYQLPFSRVDEALLGQASGMNVQATENQAGSEPTITIRGFGSISADSRPAIVIDGVVLDYDFLANLDVNDVKSFEILKDASSAAIYGSEGSNGVIIITTKSGKSGKTKYSYNAYSGLKKARISDAYYFSLADHAKEEELRYGSLSGITQNKLLIGQDTDWQDVIFDNKTIVSHSFSASGGGDKVRFAAGLKYLNDQGVILTDDYKVYSGKLKLDFNLSDKIEVGLNIIPSFSKRRILGDDVYESLRQVNWLPLYHTEETIQYVNRDNYPDIAVGDYATQRHFDEGVAIDGQYYDISNSSENNPGAKLLEREFYANKFKLFTNVFGSYEFNENLKFTTSLGFTYEDTENTEWQGVLATNDGASGAYYEDEDQLYTRYVFDNYFSYEKSIGSSDLNLVAGITLHKRKGEYKVQTGTGYTNDLIKNLSGASNVSTDDYTIERNKFGAFARASYAYDDRFLVSASFRRDGSSVFGTETKYGNFPAVSVGWNIANERFLSRSNFFSDFKLRFSYGITGNENFDTGNDLTAWYSYLSLLQSSNAVIEGVVVNGVSNANIPNNLLQWEGSEEINPGVDFALLDGKITGSFEWYKRTSDNLLVANPVSLTTGFDSLIENVGEIVNTGYELEVISNNISNDDFGWKTSLIATTNKNELTDFGSSNGRVSSISSSIPSEWINLEGNPVSSFYGWVVDQDLEDEYLIREYGVVGGESPYAYVKDLNGDGIIDEDDKTILGDPYPYLVWSLTNSFRYKNLDLSFMFQGSHGAEVSNIGDHHFFHFFDGDLDFDTDTTPNQEFLRPKISTNSIIQDASYVALRNVNLGFSLPDHLIEKVKMERVRVYFVGQNLLYFTSNNYTGFNPEGVSSTSPINYGSQNGGSPIFRTVSLGLNIDF